MFVLYYLMSGIVLPFFFFSLNMRSPQVSQCRFATTEHSLRGLRNITFTKIHYLRVICFSDDFCEKRWLPIPGPGMAALQDLHSAFHFYFRECDPHSVCVCARACAHANARDLRDMGLIFHHWFGKIAWRRAQQPLQYSCPENPMDKGAWQATVCPKL